MTDNRGFRRALTAAALTLGALAAAIGGARWAASAQSAPQPAATAAEQGPRLEVSAGSLSVDDATRQAVFEGEVTARWGEWTLRCDDLTVRYAGEGRVAGVTARGAPLTLAWSGGTVQAARARLEPAAGQDPGAALQAGVLWLEGDPILRRGRSALRGDRVRVDLRTRQVKVEGVRGHLSPQDL
jgi:lipopolysaccharide transport protein LptA